MACSRKFNCWHYRRRADGCPSAYSAKNAQRQASAPWAKRLKDLGFLSRRTSLSLEELAELGWEFEQIKSARKRYFTFAARENPARPSCRPCHRPPAWDRAWESQALFNPRSFFRALA